ARGGRPRPSRRPQRAERRAGPRDRARARRELAVPKILERRDDRRRRGPSRINACDAHLVLRRRFGGGTPALTRVIGEREQAPVDEPDGGRGRSVIARRAAAGGASREERTERCPERETRRSRAF